MKYGDKKLRQLNRSTFAHKRPDNSKIKQIVSRNARRKVRQACRASSHQDPDDCDAADYNISATDTKHTYWRSRGWGRGMGSIGLINWAVSKVEKENIHPLDVKTHFGKLLSKRLVGDYALDYIRKSSGLVYRHESEFLYSPEHQVQNVIDAFTSMTPEEISEFNSAFNESFAQIKICTEVDEQPQVEQRFFYQKQVNAKLEVKKKLACVHTVKNKYSDPKYEIVSLPKLANPYSVFLTYLHNYTAPVKTSPFNHWGRLYSIRPDGLFQTCALSVFKDWLPTDAHLANSAQVNSVWFDTTPLHYLRIV